MRVGHLEMLAGLIRTKNEADAAIAEIIGRPAAPGNIGEFVAAEVFGIDLADRANQAGYDGVFRAGPLEGKTVNIKTYGMLENMLDVGDHACDYYLVLTGPAASSSVPRGVRPWVISQVFLFPTLELIQDIEQRGVKRGVATSIRKEFWGRARIFPRHPEALLQINAEGEQMLRLFAGAP